MSKVYLEISELKAKDIYGRCGQIYITNDSRKFWRVPVDRDYVGMYAPRGINFYRSYPRNEGKTRFFIRIK